MIRTKILLMAITTFLFGNAAFQQISAQNDMVPINIKLPKAMFVGTPTNLSIPNLEKPLGKPRPPFYAPKGTQNIALGKPVTGSDTYPTIGDLKFITDGKCEAEEGYFVELGPMKQHVIIDLQKPQSIYAIVVWHYHKQPRVYFDVIVQVADDAKFTKNVRTLFNNDTKNALGQGNGKDLNYVETAEGKLIDAKGQVARFVRLFSNGNNADDLNHYIEVAVYGK
jgi:hypothetical protein